MTGYIVGRLLANVVVVWVVVTTVFFATQVLAGNYAENQLVGQFFSRTSSNTSTGGAQSETANDEFNAAVKELRRQLGTDKSVPVQYWNYVGKIVRGDFSNSFATRESSMSRVMEAVPYTIQLAGMSLVVAGLLALPIGVIAGLNRGRWPDEVLRTLATLGVAAPSFIVATIGTLFVLRFDLWTIDVVNHPLIWEDPQASLKVFLLPAIAGGFSGGAIIMRMLRSQILEVLSQDYVRTARAKGLVGRDVILRHVVRNALIPVVTVLGLVFSAMLGGQVILEQMFNIPGLGQTILHSITVRDYPVVQSGALVIAVLVVTINLFVDLSYFVIDPRMKRLR